MVNKSSGFHPGEKPAVSKASSRSGDGGRQIRKDCLKFRSPWENFQMGGTRYGQQLSHLTLEINSATEESNALPRSYAILKFPLFCSSEIILNRNVQ